MWTEQTVETLKKFALEGRSAAWIAAAIGAPSRSAVIGKAKRIGIKLNGAGTRTTPVADRLRPPPPPTAWGYRRADQARPQSRPLSPGRSALQPPAKFPLGRPERRRDRWLSSPVEVGEMRRLAFAEIGEAECRWPLGDPAEENFSFCGLQVVKGHAYCAGHCRMVYRLPAA